MLPLKDFMGPIVGAELSPHLFNYEKKRICVSSGAFLNHMFEGCKMFFMVIYHRGCKGRGDKGPRELSFSLSFLFLNIYNIGLKINDHVNL